MSTEKDVQIFCSGVTQYAMSSGKFDIEDLPRLADAAYDWFVGRFGPPTASEPSKQSPPPSAFQGPSGASGGDSIPAESAPIHAWSNDKAFYGKKDSFRNGKPTRDCTWGEWLADATAGDEEALYALKAMAGSKLGPKPEYHKSDRLKIGRAKRCLELVRQAK